MGPDNWKRFGTFYDYCTEQPEGGECDGRGSSSQQCQDGLFCDSWTKTCMKPKPQFVDGERSTCSLDHQGGPVDEQCEGSGKCENRTRRQMGGPPITTGNCYKSSTGLV